MRGPHLYPPILIVKLTKLKMDEIGVYCEGKKSSPCVLYLSQLPWGYFCLFFLSLSTTAFSSKQSRLHPLQLPVENRGRKLLEGGCVPPVMDRAHLTFHHTGVTGEAVKMLP